MNLEITTVETSQGEALEKQSITNVNIDLSTDTVVAYHNKTVVRRDGVEVPMQTSVPIHIGGAHTANYNFTKAEVDTILDAKEAFLEVLEGVLKSKKTVLQP